MCRILGGGYSRNTHTAVYIYYYTERLRWGGRATQQSDGYVKRHRQTDRLKEGWEKMSRKGMGQDRLGGAFSSCAKERV